MKIRAAHQLKSGVGIHLVLGQVGHITSYPAGFAQETEAGFC
jgi:hypothetical protein